MAPLLLTLGGFYLPGWLAVQSPEKLAEVMGELGRLGATGMFRTEVEQEYPLVDARIFGPLSFKFNIQGMEYWNIKSQWSMGSYHPIEPDELRVAWNVGSRSLDGSLVYPGTNFEIYSSLRFESFRDGMEDYEYFVLLEHAAGKEVVKKLVDKIAPNWWDYSKQPDKLLEVRQELAEQISQPRARSD